MATIRIIGVIFTTGRTIAARVFVPGNTEVAAANVPLTEFPSGSGQYGGQVTATLADTGELPYEWEARDITSTTFDLSTAVVAARRIYGWVYGGTLSRAARPDEIGAALSAAHGNGSWLTGGAAGGAATATGEVLITDQITQGVGDSFDWQFIYTGLDMTGWTAIAFTVKRDATDDDDEALIAITKHNPGDVSDGLALNNGRTIPLSDHVFASITVDTTGPDVVITVHADPLAMDLPPSPDSTPWAWELTLWQGIRRHRIGAGAYTSQRTLRRGFSAP
jgi:hypothetical protein